MRELILAAFDGENNSSRIVLEQARVSCRKLLLPNGKEKAVEALREAVSSEPTFCVIILGERSRICDKIAVEPSAGLCGDIRRTSMDVSTVRRLIREMDCDAYISRGCGNGRDSYVYYHALGMGVNAVLLHIPSAKNISDMNVLVKAVENVVNNAAAIPALL